MPIMDSGSDANPPASGIKPSSVIPDTTFLQIFDLIRKVSDPESRAARAEASIPGFRIVRLTPENHSVFGLA
jgi:hypothetical protein